MYQLNVSLQHSIATLAANGWSARKIARELGIHRETVARFLPVADSKPAIPPAGSLKEEDSNQPLCPGSKAGRTSHCAPLAALTEQGLLGGCRLSAFTRIWLPTTASPEAMIRSNVSCAS